MVGRFAPSPSRRIHLGNILCCLLAWLSARQQGGQVVLRIEDLDTARCPRRYADRMEADLRWLGLEWDQGPTVGGPDGPYYQSERTALYQAALQKLESMGLVYPCFCTRAQLHAAQAPNLGDHEPVYPGTCARLTPEEIAAREATRRPALRLRVPDETVGFTDGHYGPFAEQLARDCGDYIIRRSDGLWGYQLAVVVDDALSGVTQVVRGRDILFSTPRQIELLRALGYDAPSYVHIPLLTDSEGRRLAKRDRDLDLTALSRRHTPQEILGMLSFACGLLPEQRPMTLEALIPLFDWARVRREDIRVPEGF